MLFNSFEFIFVFLPLTVSIYFFLGRTSEWAAATWLAIASLGFYAWWSPVYLVLLLASIAFNFSFGAAIAHRALKHRRNDALLLVAVLTNLGGLCYFKYLGFLVDLYGGQSGIASEAEKIILPLGISFFTFTQIAFLVDCYRGKVGEKNFIHYVLFVSYFPHLIAGPVLHHAQIMPQFKHENGYHVNWENIAVGVTIFTIGLAKKVLVADSLAQYATPIFEVAKMGHQPTVCEAWIGALAYTLQLYFDFSGYSDMAIGLSKLFNVNLPINFASPYKAASIIEFWHRWHMTLSAFLRDYLYIALGGNRRGNFRRYVNLFITMVLGGAWHGAGWTFILWGGLHGLFLLINHAFRSLRGAIWPDYRMGQFARFISITLTFVCVVVAWVFFRADSIATAMQMVSGMVGMHGISLPERIALRFPEIESLTHFGIMFNGLAPISRIPGGEASAWIAAGLATVWLMPNTQEIFNRFLQAPEARGDIQPNPPLMQWKPNFMFACGAGLLLCFTIMSITRLSEFLYFQF